MPIVESKKRNSILGGLALVIGFTAVGLSAIDVPGLPSVTVGPWTLPFALALDLGAGALALVSLLLTAKSRRTGTELPGAALAVVLGAGAIFYFRHRTPPAPVAPAQSLPTTAPSVKAISPAMPVKSPSNPSAHLPPAAPVAANASTAAKNATQQTAAMLRQQQLAAVKDARANFSAAQTRIVDSLKTDSVFQQAKAQSDAADIQLREARATYPPGDPKLVAISQSALSARDALNQLIAGAVAKDPDAATSKAKLDALTQPN